MVRFAEYFKPIPIDFWQTVRQVGVEHVISELEDSPDPRHDNTGDRPWDYVPLARRDVRGTPTDFVETFHDEGMTDMLACMEAWHDFDFDGVLRPDHVPTLAGEPNDDPAYALLGRLHAIGYMQGLREAAARGKELGAAAAERVVGA